MDLVFRWTSLPASNSKSTVGCKTSSSAMVMTSPAHYVNSEMQRTGGEVLPSVSSCSEPVGSFSSSSSSLKMFYNFHQLPFPNSSDLNSSPTSGRDVYRCTLVTQEEENLCTFWADDRGGNNKEDGGNIDGWILDESVKDELKSHDSDDRPLSRPGLHSSFEGDMSLISENNNGDKESILLSSSSATNLMDNHNLHLHSSSLEALSSKSDYNKSKCMHMCVNLCTNTVKQIHCCHCIVRAVCNSFCAPIIPSYCFYLILILL